MRTARLIAQPIVIALVMALGVRHAVHIYSIPSGSMEPTLQVGDHILVTPYRFADPRKGDVIVFHSPVNRDELMVKRIAGVAGDLVEGNQGKLIVPAGCYFVLGDNRANSFDSRQWGVLPRSEIVGRARLILWSSGNGTTEPLANAAPRARVIRSPRALHTDRLFRVIE